MPGSTRQQARAAADTIAFSIPSGAPRAFYAAAAAAAAMAHHAVHGIAAAAVAASAIAVEAASRCGTAAGAGRIGVSPMLHSSAKGSVGCR